MINTSLNPPPKWEELILLSKMFLRLSVSVSGQCFLWSLSFVQQYHFGTWMVQQAAVQQPGHATWWNEWRWYPGWASLLLSNISPQGFWKKTTSTRVTGSTYIATHLLRILKRYNLYQKRSTLLILWRKWSGVSKTYSEQVLYLPFCGGRQGLPLCVIMRFHPLQHAFEDSMVFHTYQKSQLGQFLVYRKLTLQDYIEHPKVTPLVN